MKTTSDIIAGWDKFLNPDSLKHNLRFNGISEGEERREFRPGEIQEDVRAEPGDGSFSATTRS